jgi:hypothetical protein
MSQSQNTAIAPAPEVGRHSGFAGFLVQRWSQPERLLLDFAIAAAIMKVCLAVFTFGTNDVWTFTQYPKLIDQNGLIAMYYARDNPNDPLIYNHPPFTSYYFHFLAMLARYGGLAYGTWLRLIDTAADVGSLYLVYKIMRRLLPPGAITRQLALLAISPTLIFISGFHGNNDPLNILLLVLAVYFATEDSFLLAGAAFGMSLNVKVWPLVLVPAFFFYPDGWRRRIQFFAATGMVFFVGSLPFILQDPRIILTRILGYGSYPGQWGLTKIFTLKYEWALTYGGAYIAQAKPLIAAIAFILAFLMNRRPKAPLFAQVGVLSFLFLALTPGFSIQYLAWLVPWTVWAPFWYSLAFQLAAGSFTFWIYTHWCQGLPWHSANGGFGFPPSSTPLGLLLWAIVALYVPLTYFGVRRLQQASATPAASDRNSLSERRNQLVDQIARVSNRSRFLTAPWVKKVRINNPQEDFRTLEALCQAYIDVNRNIAHEGTSDGAASPRRNSV